MIIIRVTDQEAYWDEDALRWQSSNQVFEDVLNSTIPEEIGSPGNVFLVGGVQGLALAAARKKFPGKIEVVKKTPPPQPPEEEPGVVY